MCNCNNKGDNATEYLIEESVSFTKNDPTISSLLANLKIKEARLGGNRELYIKNLMLVNLSKKIQKAFRIFRTLKKNMNNANLVCVF